MALIEEIERSGNRLFRSRSYLPLVLYVLAAAVIFSEGDTHANHRAVGWSLLCLSVSLFGQLIRAFTVGYTPKGTSGRNTKEGQVAETLNTSGIYSLVRHPLYLGNFFMWMGIVMYVGNWWFTAVCALLFWVYYERIMFAEEAFLRKKFGAHYTNWSAKTPAFFPNFKRFQKANVQFSVRNVLKREYNGFFAVFLSFSMLNALKNYVFFEVLDYDLLLDPVWQFGLPAAFIIFIVLRSLKKYTKVLNVEGREYIG
jgi:protein-S-isoprenylcysteine O-methyltransferase Ste14